MQKANTAVFYSISSTQKGLAEINLGNFLIKQVAKRVITEFPSVDTLITLSPIPGFRNWLHTQVEAESTALHQDGGVVTFTPLLCSTLQQHESKHCCHCVMVMWHLSMDTCRRCFLRISRHSAYCYRRHIGFLRCLQEDDTGINCGALRLDKIVFQFLHNMTTLSSTLQGRLALSILTDDEVLHVNNMFKANASINSRLAALDHLAALIEQQDNPSTQQSAMLSLQVSVVQLKKYPATSCQHCQCLGDHGSFSVLMAPKISFLPGTVAY